MGNSPSQSDDNEYPIFLYDPEKKAVAQEKRAVSLLSEPFKVQVLAKSIGNRSFLLIAVKDFDMSGVLEELKEGIYGRKLQDFEEGEVLKEVLRENRENFKAHVFCTREDFESEDLLRNEDIEEEMRENGVKEVEKKFREEFLFWEMKRRGLKEKSEEFERTQRGQGFEDFIKQVDAMACAKFYESRLKELTMKRKQEKRKLIYFVYLGEAWRRSCAFTAAEDFLRIPFSFLSEICPNSHAASLASLRRIGASVNLDMGDYLKTIEHHKDAVAIRTSVYGADNYETAVVSRDLASTYCVMKKFELALGLSTKALEIMKATYGEMHFETASSYDSRASILTPNAPKKEFPKVSCSDFIFH